jgi:hypothetical protein
MIKKKKTYVLMVAKTFQKSHPRAGEPTLFPDHILNGKKIHTIRANYDGWKKKVDAINAGEAILSIRTWSGKPYRSNQEIHLELTEVGIEKASIYEGIVRVHENDYYYSPYKITVCENDGLSTKDFYNWFPESQKNLAIIHFTKFRYND